MLPGQNIIFFFFHISVRNLPNTKKQTEDKVVGWVDQPMVLFTVSYLMNLCESGNAVLEAVQISPIPFHHSPHLSCLSQRLVTSLGTLI